MSQYVSPTGSPIIGTLENLPALCRVNVINDDGSVEYANQTTVNWDGQETVTRNGKVVFVDDDGAEWTFDRLVKVNSSGKLEE